MRRIGVLLTTALAGLAMMAAVAAPAQADREFYVTDHFGVECYEPCLDTGYEGYIKGKDPIGQTLGTCDVSFDIEVELYGALEVVNAETTNCTGGMQGLGDCAEPWPGQLRWPDQGHPQIDVTTCFQTAWNGPVYHDVTYQVAAQEGIRYWGQMAPVWGGIFEMAGSEFADPYQPDNIQTVFL